jgi:outer membrane protein
MRNRILMLLLLIPLVTFSQSPVRLDLEKSINMALKGNNELRISRLEKEKADEKVSEAYGSAIFPTIRGSINYSRAIERGIITIETPFFSGSFPQGTENTLTIGANLEQPLFTGAVFLAVRVAKTYAEIANQMYEGRKQEIAVNVARAYYSLLLSREVVELSRVNYELAEENFRNTEKMYEAGIVPEYDLIRARVQAANILPEVQQSENSLRMSENMLKILTGLELSAEIIIEDSLFFNMREEPDYQEALQQLYNRNRTLKQLELQVSLQDDAAKYEFSKHFPELYFTGNWQTQAQENDPRPFNDWRYNRSFYLGLNLRVPIFDGFQTSSKVTQAKLTHEQAKEEHIGRRKQIESRLEEVLLSLKHTRERIISFRGTITQAETGYEIASKRYASGVGAQLELVDAMAQLTRARVNYYGAIYDYHILHAELNQLIAD